MRTPRVLPFVLLPALALLAVGCGDGDAASKGATSTSREAAGGGHGGPPASDPDDRGGEQSTFTVQVNDGQVVGGPQPMPVASGDAVRIEILSDAADEVHLHGIDTELKLEAGVPAALEFTAKDQGSFELEMHDSGLVLGNVQVS